MGHLFLAAGWDERVERVPACWVQAEADGADERHEVVRVGLDDLERFDGCLGEADQVAAHEAELEAFRGQRWALYDPLCVEVIGHR